MMTTTEQSWACRLLVGSLLLQLPAAVSLMMTPRGNRAVGASPRNGMAILASAATSREEALGSLGLGSPFPPAGSIAGGASPPAPSDGAGDAPGPRILRPHAGSTAVILNMNARSVTAPLISVASAIVGEDNVFVTRTFEDARLAAREVARRGRPPVDGDPSNDDDGENPRGYSLVVPVGGDGTLSGWINTMVDEIMSLHELEQDAGEGGRERTNETEPTSNNNKTTAMAMSVEEALQQMPLVGYIPMGTGNGMGYVIGCKAENGKNGKEGSGSIPTTKRSILSKMNVLTWTKRRKLERARRVMARLKDVGDAVQEAEHTQRTRQPDIANAISGKCSVVEMPLMEVTHPPFDPTYGDVEKGDLCFFAGAGFDSLMLHDFQRIKAWSRRSSTRAPSFVKDALSSVAGYCVALVGRTLPRALRHGTHRIHVEVTTRDAGALWVDHRRGDFSEPAVGAEAAPDADGRHHIYSGPTGIIAASTTPYYGGGMRLFPYARLVPGGMQLRLGRISPLTGFFNIPKIFEGSYREKGERSFGLLDFIGRDFEVEVTGGKRYEEYARRQSEKRKSELRDDDDRDANDEEQFSTKGFPFQHSGESMGIKERFRLRVVQKSVRFVSFLEPRVVVDE